MKMSNLYKEKEHLWNCFDHNYKNRDFRKSSLEKIDRITLRIITSLVCFDSDILKIYTKKLLALSLGTQ